MENYLRAYLNKKFERSNFAIVYHIGNSFTGETEFRLNGEGQYYLSSTVTEGRRKLIFSGKLSAETVERVVEELLEVQIWKVGHLREKPKEDDPEAFIAVETGHQVFKVVLWISEIPDSPPFLVSQELLLELIKQVSAGEVLESGR